MHLRYELEYPLDLIIHKAAVEKYQRVLGFVLEIHRAMDALHECWLKLKHLAAAHKQHASSIKSGLAEYHCLRHHMFHFVTVLHGYLLSQLLYTSWAELLETLNASHPDLSSSDSSTRINTLRHRPARDLHELRRRHDEYLSAVTDRALLSPRTSQVLDIIRQALGCIHDLSENILHLSTAEHLDHPGMHMDLLRRPLLEIKGRFEHWTGFLHKVIFLMLKKGRERQAHLQVALSLSLSVYLPVCVFVFVCLPRPRCLRESQ